MRIILGLVALVLCGISGGLIDSNVEGLTPIKVCESFWSAWYCGRFCKRRNLCIPFLLLKQKTFCPQGQIVFTFNN